MKPDRHKQKKSAAYKAIHQSGSQTKPKKEKPDLGSNADRYNEDQEQIVYTAKDFAELASASSRFQSEESEITHDTVVDALKFDVPALAWSLSCLNPEQIVGLQVEDFESSLYDKLKAESDCLRNEEYSLHPSITAVDHNQSHDQHETTTPENIFYKNTGLDPKKYLYKETNNSTGEDPAAVPSRATRQEQKTLQIHSDSNRTLEQPDTIKHSEPSHIEHSEQEDGNLEDWLDSVLD